MTKTALPSLTIFFPCYNDSGTIASLVILADKVAKEVTNDYEIIVVDDGSTDSSREILVSLARNYPFLRLVLHEGNKGYGGALRSGFDHAGKEWIFYTDGDNQYDVRELRRLAEYAAPDIDVINGYKVERSDSLIRILVGKIYHRTMKILFGLAIRDVDCDFRLIRKSVFNTVNLKYRSGVVCVEMIKKMESSGFRFAYVPVQHHFRTHGKSQFFNFPRLLKVGVDILRLWIDIFIFSKVAFRNRGIAKETAGVSPRIDR